MKFRSVILKLLILTLGVAGAMALSSCFTGSAILLGSCIACNESCDDKPDSEKPPREAVSYSLEEDGESYYVSQVYDVHEVEIVPEYRGKPVSRISPYAFCLYKNTGCGSEQIPLWISKLTLPASIKIVGGDVYAHDCTISEINYSGTLSDWCGIENAGGLFTGNTKLMIGGSLVTDFTAPESVTVIKGGLFKNYRYLSSAVLHDGIVKIGDSAFKNCTRLESVALPQSGALTLGEEAFRGCSALESVALPEGVTALPYGLFHGCGALKTVNASGVIAEMGEWCFGGCVNLEGIDLSASTVAVIPEHAFSDCRGICSFVIPASVKIIAENAFSGCKIYEIYNLSDYPVVRGEGIAAHAIAIHKSLDEPSVVITVGDYKFLNTDGGYLCAYTGGSKELSLPEKFGDGGYKISGGLFKGSDITSVHIPGRVNEICGEAFAECRNLAEVTGADGVKTVGDRAFSNCKKLSAISLGGAEEIGSYAFEGCAALGGFSAGAGLKRIDARAFSGCSALESVDLACEIIYPYAFEGCGLVYADLTVKIIENYAFKNCRYLSKVNLREGVEEIKTDAFLGCVSLKELNLPSTVTYLGGQSELKGLEGLEVSTDNAVYTGRDNCIIHSETNKLVLGCKNSVIPDDGSVEIIGSIAFESCELDEITLPESVKEIGWAAFRGSTVRAINLENAEKLSSYAFAKCASLQRVTLPTKLKDIPSYAFLDCVFLEEIVVPEGVERIFSSAFSGCEGLVDVVLPASLKTIGGGAFSRCVSLESVTIPEGVTLIDDSAFYCCEKLREVIFPATVEKIAAYAFKRCDALARVSLPAAAEVEEDAFDEATVIERY